MLWARAFPGPYFKEVCTLMKTKLNPFCMLGCCWDPLPPTPQPVPSLSSLEGNHSQPHPGGMMRESLPLLGVSKTPFPFLQRLSINPLSQCYAVLDISSPIACSSGYVWVVAIEVVIFSYLSAPIKHCSLEQWHIKIWVHLALCNHLASEMDHKVTKPQGKLWRPSGRKKNLSTCLASRSVAPLSVCSFFQTSPFPCSRVTAAWKLLQLRTRQLVHSYQESIQK